MKQTLVSVIVPSYNCGPKLEATLKTVLSQPAGVYELIIVDGGSTDDTLDVVRKYAGRLRYVSEPDRGVYDAINKGVAMSSGRYVFILGAGDRLRDGVLGRVAGMLPDAPSFAYGDAYLEYHGVLRGGALERADFIKTNICQQAIFYERSVFSLLGGFDLNYKVFADWAFNMKCFADRRVRKIYLGQIVSDFEGGGISDTQEDARFEKDFPTFIRKYVGLGHYLRYKTYVTRVSFYHFRHGLADSIKGSAARFVSSLRRQKPQGFQRRGTSRAEARHGS